MVAKISCTWLHHFRVSGVYWFYLLQPELYRAKTLIYPPLEKDIYQTKLVFEYLEQDRGRNLEQDEKRYYIDPELIFDKFVAEFRDYEEVTERLLLQSAVTEILNKTEDENYDIVLSELASSFRLIPPIRNKDPNWYFAYEWQEPSVGRLLARDIINAVLKNVHSSLVSELEFRLQKNKFNMKKNS